MDMNISRMKNIIVLKDLPSNIVDEAIVILKDKQKVKIAENNVKSHSFLDYSDGNSEVVINEAETLVNDYIKRLEKQNIYKKNQRKVDVKNKKFQICCVIFGITSIISILINFFR